MTSSLFILDPKYTQANEGKQRWQAAKNLFIQESGLPSASSALAYLVSIRQNRIVRCLAIHFWIAQLTQRRSAKCMRLLLQNSIPFFSNSAIHRSAPGNQSHTVSIFSLQGQQVIQVYIYNNIAHDFGDTCMDELL